MWAKNNGILILLKIELQQRLQQYFGYSTFRPLQENIIGDVLEGKDVFVLMPTGGGKSLCYQLPSVMKGGTTVVVSPLIALMKDQVDGLVANGIRAVYLNSSLSMDQQHAVMQRVRKAQVSLLYVAPERLVMDSFLELLNYTQVNFFAIDEAHCISQWGHDFRPEYRQLDILRKRFPDKPIIALTATATPRVKQDILDRLGITQAAIYQGSFNRKNLSYTILRKSNSFRQLFSYISRHRGESGIIYCQSRKAVEQLALRLQENGIKALPYHAGLPNDIRKENQEKFIHEDADVMVATIAFGMGIDKPNVRFVIHYALPKSIEHYYQETGRAGRDGLASECVLLYSYGDVFFYERFIAEKQDEEERAISKAQLQRMLEYAESNICRRALLLQYFDETFSEQNCKSCDNCLTTKETFDATVLAQKILSCVYRTGQRFGIMHIIGVLTGSKAQNILDRDHHLLSTYGIVTNYDKATLRLFMYELIQYGYLSKSKDQYGILSLTPKSAVVLKGTQKVSLTKPEMQIQTTQTEQPDMQYNQTLFNRLRSLRKEISDKQNLPPYIIFGDKSLKEMAVYFPQTTEQFSMIYGVGEEKLQKYGDQFIKEIILYCEPLHLKPLQKIRNVFPNGHQTNSRASDTAAVSLSLFKKGKTVSQIAKERGFTEETIHRHLQQAYLRGETITVSSFVSYDKQQVIKKAFEVLGHERLAPVKEKLGENYSYTEIRWVQTEVIKGQES